MRVELLRMENVRCFGQVELRPGPGVNVLVGANGAGKTSVLEALHVLSHARSFRAGPREALVRRGTPSCHVFAVVEQGGARHRLGLARVSGRWEARCDGVAVQRLEELLRRILVVSFDPGSHALISGGAEERRAFLPVLASGGQVLAVYGLGVSAPFLPRTGSPVLVIEFTEKRSQSS